jgi:hypothetical protein
MSHIETCLCAKQYKYDVGNIFSLEFPMCLTLEFSRVAIMFKQYIFIAFI